MNEIVEPRQGSAELDCWTLQYEEPDKLEVLLKLRATPDDVQRKETLKRVDYIKPKGTESSESKILEREKKF